MNKLAIIIVSLVLVTAVGLGGCVTINPPTETAPTTESAPAETAVTAPELVSPHNGATDVELTPRFLWKAVPEATVYELAVSLNSDFSHRVISVSMGDTAYQSPPDLRYYPAQEYDTLTPLTRYYWMVAAKSTGGGCSPVWTFTTGTAAASEAEIHEAKIHNYRSSYDLQGKPDPNFIEATFSWITNKPCFYWFEIKPVDFETPYTSSYPQPFDTSTPLIQQVEHQVTITLKPGILHSYALVVWDRERNSARREGTFQAEGVSIPASSPQPESSIDEIFLSRWGHTYYNNAPRVSFDSFDIDKLIIQTSLQIPWQLCYEPSVFDCSEMTAYLEYMLERHGYTTQICQGECILGEHAWVLVYNNVARCWIPIEATSLAGTLEPILFRILTLGMTKDHYTPRWRWEDIYDVRTISEYDWWNSPYADQLVEASDRAKL